MPHSRSSSSDSEPNLSFTSMAAASSSSPLAATPDSTTSNSNTHQRRSASAKSLQSPEFELERGFSSSSTGAAGAQTSTNNNNNHKSSSNNSPQNSHNDTSSRMTMTEAEASALERALAAGISRDEFEKARAGILDMLNGSQQNKQKSSRRKGRSAASAAASTSSLKAVNEGSSNSATGRDYDAALSSSAPTSRQVSMKGTTSASRRSSGNTTARLSLSTSNSTSSLALSQAPSVFTPSDSGPSTANTFRTSVSSSQAAEDDFAGSPPTSDEEEIAAIVTRKSDKRRVQQQQQHPHANESTESNKSSDPDTSFNAATAAAAALGMLASSPAKPTRRTEVTLPSASTSSASYALQEQQGGSSAINGSSFTQHRVSSTANGANLVSSSSPGSGGHNSAVLNSAHSPRSGSRSPNRQGARASSSNATATELGYASATSRGKSTTPVRTRLEDIALKSSAQIRRTRERLGLDETEEMMDMDTDARHQAQIMRSSMGPIDSDEQMLASDEEGEQRQQGAQSPLNSRSTGSGLAPAFAYSNTNRSPGGTSYSQQYQQEYGSADAKAPPASPTRSARGGHRRMASYDMSGGSGKGRAVGMLDRFMEESSSPKAAQAARFGGPLEDHDSRLDYTTRTFDEDMAFGNDDRSVRLGKRRAIEDDTFQPGDLVQEDDEDAEYQPHPVQSTPKGRMHPNKAALLRSAGNDLPSPLLAQVRSLEDVAYSPAHHGEGHHMHSLLSPRYRLSEPSSDSVAGSARKRKASYDLASPRQVVRSYETSPPPLSPLRRESMSPPLQFSAKSSASYRQDAYAASSPRFSVRQTPTHPSSRGSTALFEGPGSSRASSRSSRAPPDSQERPLNLFPYNQGLRESELDSLNLRPPAPLLDYPSRPSSAASDSLSQSQQQSSRFETYHHEPIAPIPTSASKKRETRKKRQSTARSAQNDQGSEQDDFAPLQRSQSQQSNILFASTGSSNATPLPEDFVFANIPIGQYDAKTKPPFSYAALIGQAIFSTPNRRMSLADIYTYIMTLYPFYKKQDAGWQNSIRHNLSLNECFVKTQRLADEPGKGCLWSISPGTEEQFTGGNFYKKGKVPKLSSSANGINSANSSKAGSVAGGSTSARKSKKAGSEISDAQSVASADDSFDNMSMNSSSYMANITQQPLSASGYGSASQHHMTSRRHEEQQQLHPSMRPPSAQAYRLPRPPQPARPRASSNLRQQSRKYYDEEHDAYVDEEEADSGSFDMEPQLEEVVQQPPEQLGHPRRAITLRHQRAASGNQGYISSQPLQHQLSSPEKPMIVRIKREDVSRDGDGSMEHEQHSRLDVHDSRNYPASERSVSAEPSQPPFDDRQPPLDSYDPIPPRQRALLNSPPIMASPPTTVLARISQPYQPFRSAFSIPGQSSEREAALMSSPPAAGIMPSESRGSGLPPPTPRSASNQGLNNSDEDFNSSRSIFLPAPNIRPGKVSLTRKAVGDDDESFEPEKPVLPPISMISSPGSAPLQLVTQSPISSLRASAATRRSTSPSPKAGSSHSSTASIASLNRSPTMAKSRSSVSMDFFKTPDRFGASASAGVRTSPQKLAQIAGNNASRALQSFQQTTHSTPKLPGTRSLMGMVTPGGYYDPYEYGAVLDEELDRMAGSREAEYSGHRDDSRRALPFPSPIDRTPKWQPWSPW